MEENHLTLATPTKKDCNLAVIMDVAMFFVFIIAPFVIYLTKPDRPFLKDQACENLNVNYPALKGGA
jgi:uncharacterized Tic20 family protein